LSSVQRNTEDDGSSMASRFSLNCTQPYSSLLHFYQ